MVVFAQLGGFYSVVWILKSLVLNLENIQNTYCICVYCKLNPMCLKVNLQNHFFKAVLSLCFWSSLEMFNSVYYFWILKCGGRYFERVNEGWVKLWKHIQYMWSKHKQIRWLPLTGIVPQKKSLLFTHRHVIPNLAEHKRLFKIYLLFRIYFEEPKTLVPIDWTKIVYMFWMTWGWIVWQNVYFWVYLSCNFACSKSNSE